MAKQGRAHGEEAWRNAKKICRLNARQVEMARRLGMNPIKLPGLRPAPRQRWKVPVGSFIEDCYEKRFGSDAHDRDSPVLEPGLRQHTRAPEPLRHAGPLPDLVCYLTNLADDLQAWLAQATVDRELLSQVSEDLRAIAQALDTGAPISPVPGIPVPPRPTRGARSRRRDPLEPAFSDDDIPF